MWYIIIVHLTKIAALVQLLTLIKIKNKILYTKSEFWVFNYDFSEFQKQILLTGNRVFNSLHGYICHCVGMHPPRAVERKLGSANYHAVRQLPCYEYIMHCWEWIYCSIVCGLDVTCWQQKAPLLHLNLHTAEIHTTRKFTAFGSYKD